MRRNKKKLIVLLTVLAIIFIPACLLKTKAKTKTEDLRGEMYAGSDQCKNCHKDIYDSYVDAAHFNTSSNHLPGAMQTAFKPGNNVFAFNDSIKVVMEKLDSQFYETYYLNGNKIVSHPLDIIIGSGRKAHTFLYYTDQGKIQQLPISYFMTVKAWANSPGFPADQPKFDRSIPSYCLGCHSSYTAVNQTYKGVVMEEQFEKNKMIYGIDCERCHGPAMEHVKEGKPLIKIGSLNRIQQTDLCAICHSGLKRIQQPLFNYRPGNSMADFYAPEYPRLDTSNLDVHGNQTQLMMASKCYQLSNNLTCATCHNVHTKERDNLAVFSARCINCHKEVKHSFNEVNQNNCIDCHMPLKASGVITMQTNAKMDAFPDYIRTHLITIYKSQQPR